LPIYLIDLILFYALISLVLYKKSECQLTAITWNNNLDHLVAVGAEDGTVMLFDIRTDTGSLNNIKCDRGVHKLLFNPNSEK